MNSALWLLIGLQIKGWVRFFFRGLRTVKGIAFALFGLFFFGMFVLNVLFINQTRSGASIGMDPDVLRTNGPALLLLYCLLNLVMSTGEKGISFSPAEVAHLFPAPFSRREILAYKILFMVFLGLPTTLLLAMIFRIHARLFVSAYVGLLLMFLFMSLLTIAINLIIMTIGASVYSRVRKVVIFGALTLVGGYVLFVGVRSGVGLRPDLLLQELNQSNVWLTLTLPLRSFFEVFLADKILAAGFDQANWNLLGWCVPALLVNGVLLGIVFWLDANYLETAATASARIYERLQRIRRGGIYAADETRGGKVRFGLPLPPHWGGIGPILWRQSTTALRGFGRLLFLFVLFGVCMEGPMLMTGPGGQGAAGSLVLVGFVTFLMTMMLTTLVPFDFRGDIDRIAVLKSLPISAWRMTIGQLLTPTLLLTALQWVVLGIGLGVLMLRPVFGLEQSMSGGDMRSLVLTLAAGLALVVPFNFLLFGLENMLFLLFPARILPNQGADFQAMGRQVLFVLAKTVVLGVVVVTTLAVGGGISLLTGQMALGLAGAWVVLACAAAVMVPLVAMAFNLFDVGRDTPP
jgi:Putative ABC exporter